MMEQQTEACHNLLCAVVHMALTDAFKKPLKIGDSLRLDDHAKTALDFLFVHGDPFLEIIDMEPTTFRTSLLNKMFSDERSAHYADFKKRIFRTNYRLWDELREYRDING